jgi:hypothetical protein
VQPRLEGIHFCRIHHRAVAATQNQRLLQAGKFLFQQDQGRHGYRALWHCPWRLVEAADRPPGALWFAIGQFPRQLQGLAVVEAIPDELWVVEGIFDAIVLMPHGIAAVAAMSLSNLPGDDPRHPAKSL